MLYQDNESTIKLLKNRKQSSGKQTRHIDIRYFWILDRLKKERIKVEYCPTKCMLADFFTKTLTGSLFNTFRDITLSLSPTEELAKRHTIKKKKGNSSLGSSVHKDFVEEKETNNQNRHIRNTNDENIMKKNAIEEKHMNNIKNSASEIKKVEPENELTNKKCGLNRNDENAKRYWSSDIYGRKDYKNNKEHKRILETYAGALKTGLRAKEVNME